MKETAESVLKSLLDYCKGCESTGYELDDDYYMLKKEIKEKYEEVR